MEDIIRELKDDGSESFVIKTEEGKFEIDLSENGNLYVGLLNSNEKDELTFTITKENLYLYNVFNKLYERIINFNPFGDLIDKETMIWKLLEDSSPVSGNKVIWFSDDEIEKEASRLIIEKNEIDEIKITFVKSNSKSTLNSYFVCISNKSSRYVPFNIVFMNLYKDLMNYKKENRQIHIDEYMALQRRIRTTKI